MLTLAIESSQKKLIIALFDKETILASLEDEGIRVASKHISSFVKGVLAKSNKRIEDLDRILVNTGPGSFTGLRVSVSFALGLSAGSNIKLVTYSSFDLLEFAHNNKQSVYLMESKVDEFYSKTIDTSIRTVLKKEFYEKKLKSIVCFEHELIDSEDLKRVELNINLIFNYYSSKINEFKEEDYISINYYHEFKKK
jgi:tRNA threonylcarbamoyladenosine biosynthesis protein TsaB